MEIYNKLVRDKIPDLIKKNGESCKVEILEQEAFIVALKKKLQEEVDEYLTSQHEEEAIEELADILEIIHSLAQTHHQTMNEVEKVRQIKYKERGGFNKKYYLINTNKK
jgi:predicted house-cleaning noncanonical NTP pyrophosphatase (MazG superfamily)